MSYTFLMIWQWVVYLDFPSSSLKTQLVKTPIANGFSKLSFRVIHHLRTNGHTAHPPCGWSEACVPGRRATVYGQKGPWERRRLKRREAQSQNAKVSRFPTYTRNLTSTEKTSALAPPHLEILRYKSNKISAKPLRGGLMEETGGLSTDRQSRSWRRSFDTQCVSRPQLDLLVECHPNQNPSREYQWHPLKSSWGPRTCEHVRQRGLALPSFNTSSKALVLTRAWPWWKERQAEEEPVVPAVMGGAKVWKYK